MDTTVTISTEEYRDLIASSIELKYKSKLDELEKAFKDAKEDAMNQFKKRLELEKELEKYKGDK